MSFMVYLFAFLSGLIGTAVVALVTRFLLGMFAPDRPARFGSLCATAGFVIGRYSVFGDPSDVQTILALCRGAGAFVALAVFWLSTRGRAASNADGG